MACAIARFSGRKFYHSIKLLHCGEGFSVIFQLGERKFE